MGVRDGIKVGAAYGVAIFVATPVSGAASDSGIEAEVVGPASRPQAEDAIRAATSIEAISTGRMVPGVMRFLLLTKPLRGVVLPDTGVE